MVEQHLAVRLHAVLRQNFGGGGAVEHIRHAVGAGQRFGHGDDEVCQLDQLHQHLRHIVIQRDDRALRQKACVHAQRAGVDQGDDGGVDDNVGQGIHQRGDAPGEELDLRQRAVLAVEGVDLRLLNAEGADDARAAQVFAGRAEHVVHVLLHLPVLRDGHEDDRKDHCGQHRNDGGKDQRGLGVYREGHDHRAEHDEGRAQEQTQHHVDAVLKLIDVARHAREHGRRAERVDVGIRKGVDLAQQRTTHLLGEADGGLRGKELRRDGRGKASRSQTDHQKRIAHDDAGSTAAVDAAVDDRRDHDRHQKIQKRLKQLEQRRKDGFFLIIRQILEQSFHKWPPCLCPVSQVIIAPGGENSNRIFPR